MAAARPAGSSSAGRRPVGRVALHPAPSRRAKRCCSADGAPRPCARDPDRPTAARRGARARAWCTSSGPSAKRSVRTWAKASASGRSWLRPAAPWTRIALSTTHSTVCGVATLIAWISRRAARLPRVSMSHAVLSTSRRSCSTPFRDADEPHAVADAAGAEPCLGDRGPVTLGAEEVRGRHPDVVEDDLGVTAVVAVVVAEDRHALHHRDAGGVARHQDLALLTVTSGGRVGLAHDDEDRRVRGPFHPTSEGVEATARALERLLTQP